MTALLPGLHRNNLVRNKHDRHGITVAIDTRRNLTLVQWSDTGEQGWTSAWSLKPGDAATAALVYGETA